MTKYVYRNGQMVEKETGLPMLNQAEKARPPQIPRVIGDIEPYLSPVTGEYVSGRRAKRYDLEKHDCIDADEISPRKPRGFKNKRFIEKRGLQQHAQDGVLD